MGSAVSNVATYPLSVIVARLQTQRQNRANNSDKDEKEGEEDEEEGQDEENEQTHGGA